MARMARLSGWSSRLISNEQLVISNRPTRSVIPSAVEESPRSRQGQQRLQRTHSEEILRCTQDDSERKQKSVILNGVKNLSVSTTNECRTSLEILRYTQDDSENGRLPRLMPRNDEIGMAWGCPPLPTAPSAQHNALERDEAHTWIQQLG